MFIHPKQEKNVPNVFWFVRGIHLTVQCTPLLLGLQCNKSDNSMIQRFMLSQQFPRLTLEWSKNCFNVWLFPHKKGSTADSTIYAPNRWANSLVIMTQPVSICFFKTKMERHFWDNILKDLLDCSGTIVPVPKGLFLSWLNLLRMYAPNWWANSLVTYDSSFQSNQKTT